MPRDELSVFLAGDALVVRPWSQENEPDFLALIREIRAASAAIVNLETVIHQFKGYAQADSGGTYMASPPEIAMELKWAGFTMLAHANNHTFDYGTSGVLETIEHVENAGLIVAGSGRDLQNARAPRYQQSEQGTICLVAMASDFIPYGKASMSRPDLRGRPGLNPLTVTMEQRVPRQMPFARQIGALIRYVGLRPSLLGKKRNRFGVSHQSEASVEACDLKANLDAISEGAANADLVIASIHAHRQGPWLEQFSRQAIDKGASIVFIHGPHHVRGVQLYRGKPIFYSLGDFVYETEYITRLPSEAYESQGLGVGASINDLRAATNQHRLLQARDTFEGFVASISMIRGRLTEIKLIPTDLQFSNVGQSRGRPKLASRELGSKIIERVATHSANFGTSIRYDPTTNCGYVVFCQLDKT